jgi:hypothetical protein
MFSQTISAEANSSLDLILMAPNTWPSDAPEMVIYFSMAQQHLVGQGLFINDA